MNLGSWADQFSRDTVLKEPDPKAYAGALGEKELVIYFTKEKLTPSKTPDNERFFGFITYLANLIDKMFTMFKLNTFLVKSDFETIISDMMTFLVCEKRFGLQTWGDPSKKALFMETILFSIMRINKYMIYLHEQLTSYCAKNGAKMPVSGGLTLDDLHNELPVNFDYLLKLCQYISSETRLLIQQSKAKFKKGIPFTALLKLNSQMTYYFNCSSDFLKATITGDNTWNRMGEVLQNVDMFLSTGNEILQLANTGAFRFLSKTNTQNSDDEDKPEPGGGSAPPKKMSSENGLSRGLTFHSKEAAQLLSEKEEEFEDMKKTQDEIAKGLLGSAHLFKKMQEFRGPLPTTTGMTFESIELFINFNVEGSNEQTESKHLTFEEHQVQRNIESFGKNMHKVWELTEDNQKMDLLNKVKDGINKILSPEKLLEIYGSEFLVSLLNKDKTTGYQEERLVVPVSMEEDYKTPNLALDQAKLILHTDSKDFFVSEWNKHIKNRAQELRNRKAILEAKEKEERERKEMEKYELEKRRGGWKTALGSKNFENIKPSEAFTTKPVSLADVTNYSPSMFHYFDGSKVQRNIEDIPVEEVFEVCIPEEDMFGMKIVTQASMSAKESV
jgi:hypothetical protein